MDALPFELIQARVREALAEDIGTGDATTLALVPESALATARLVAREPLVVSGLAFAEAAFVAVAADPSAVGSEAGNGSLRWQAAVRDGQAVEAGATLAEIAGPARALLTAERTALNFVQRLSGVATLTSRYVQAVAGTKAQILDTRKTTPGWRLLEKYAVRCGGGRNHRVGLYDQVLVKDNHLVALRGSTPNPIAAAVASARRSYPNLTVEVEADSLNQVHQAVEAGADIILLDNMRPEMLREAVRIVHGRARTEASGGVNLATVAEIAATGVDFISVGALTHSARSVDIALDFVES